MDTVEVYKDADGEYRWRRQSENGRIVSVSGEGYINKEHAVRMATELNVGAEVKEEA